jgi:hypothetical protein
VAAIPGCQLLLSCFAGKRPASAGGAAPAKEATVEGRGTKGWDRRTLEKSVDYRSKGVALGILSYYGIEDYEKVLPFFEALAYIPFSQFMMKPERITRTDKTGKSFEMGVSCAEDFPSVIEMYRVFSPKAVSQGLPPEDPETCHHWLKNLFKIGENFLAWRGGSSLAMLRRFLIRAGNRASW